MLCCIVVLPRSICTFYIWGNSTKFLKKLIWLILFYLLFVYFLKITFTLVYLSDRKVWSPTLYHWATAKEFIILLSLTINYNTWHFFLVVKTSLRYRFILCCCVLCIHLHTALNNSKIPFTLTTLLHFSSVTP